MLLNTEFKNPDGTVDRSLSAYEVEDQQPILVRVHAEHQAGSGLNPQALGGIDMTGVKCDRVVVTEGTGHFALTKNAHRELQFSSDADVERVASSIVAERQRKMRKVSKDEFRKFLKERLLARDSEWMPIFQSRQKWKKLAE